MNDLGITDITLTMAWTMSPYKALISLYLMDLLYSGWACITVLVMMWFQLHGCF